MLIVQANRTVPRVHSISKAKRAFQNVERWIASELSFRPTGQDDARLYVVRQFRGDETSDTNIGRWSLSTALWRQGPVGLDPRTIFWPSDIYSIEIRIWLDLPIVDRLPVDPTQMSFPYDFKVANGSYKMDDGEPLADDHYLNMFDQ